MRKDIFVALILLSPLTMVLPIMNSTSITSSTYVTSEPTTWTNTSMDFETYFASTTGLTTVQTPINIPPKGIGFMAPKGKCSQYTLPVTVKSGTNLNLELSSTNPANLYLLPTPAFQMSQDGCRLIGGALIAKNNFTAYTMHWTAAEDGTLYLLLTGPTTIIILMDHGSTEPVKQVATVTYASTRTNLKLYSSTNFTNYTTTTTVSRAPLFYPLPSIGYGLTVVGIVTAFLGPILLLAYKRREV
jgi:hypothetical protein